MCYTRLMDKLVGKINKIIVRIGKGDTYALDELFEITGRMLFYMAKKYLSDKSYSEDLVSETYLKVVKSADTFDPKQNGLNWLYKIVKNSALNHNLGDKTYCSEKLTEDIEAEIVDEWLDTILIKSAIDTLSEQDKMMIYLRFWEGYSIQEIADKIGKPLSTTHDNLKRIYKQLKKHLK